MKRINNKSNSLTAEDFITSYYTKPTLPQDIYLLEEALKAYKKIIASNPDGDASKAYTNIGNTLQYLGRLEESLIAYEKSISLKPLAKAYYNQGNAFQGLNKFNEALEAYEKANVLNPEYAKSYSNKGITLEALNRSVEALEAYEKATSLQPYYATYYNMANLLKALNRPEESLMAYKSYVDLRPNTDSYYNTSNLAQNLNKLKVAIYDDEEASTSGELQIRKKHKVTETQPEELQSELIEVSETSTLIGVSEADISHYFP
jgi:tetratricopeptide (TPR) repeat protein